MLTAIIIMAADGAVACQGRGQSSAWGRAEIATLMSSYFAPIHCHTPRNVTLKNLTGFLARFSLLL